MKKLILVCAILCAGQLSGMGYGTGRYQVKEPKQSDLLLPEIKDHVRTNLLMALMASNTIENAIKALEMTGARYDNLKDFTRLVHLLAKKFDSATITIAEQFEKLATQPTLRTVAHKYIELANTIKEAVGLRGDRSQSVIRAIVQGADVNATYPKGSSVSLLMLAINNKADASLIAVLLEAGANPHYQNENYSSLLEYADKIGASAITKELLKSAMKKQPQS